MKTKKFSKKLELNKRTIASLEVLELGNALGGYKEPGTIEVASVDEPCVKTEPPVCQTDEFTCAIRCTIIHCL
jgi:hypothetical protein